MNLLVNKTKIENQDFEPTRVVAEKCFCEYILNDTPQITLWVLGQVKKIVELYEQIYDVFNDKQLKNIIYKSYIANAPRNYLYANQFSFSKISDLYQAKKIEANDIDIIVDALIKTNLRNPKNNMRFANLSLKIYDKGLRYIKLSKNKYNFVFVPFEKTKIEFAKLYINENEYMMKFEQNYLISEDIKFDTLPDFDEIGYKLKINGKFVSYNEF